MTRCVPVMMLAVLAALGACSGAGPSGMAGAPDPTAPGGPAANDTGRPSSTLSATLAPAGTGADPDGHGMAYVGVDQAMASVCVDVRVVDVGPLSRIDVRQGQVSAAAASTPAVQVAPPDLSADGRGCTQADAAILQHLASTPGDFFVEVRTPPFPEGAVRGQLGGPTSPG